MRARQKHKDKELITDKTALSPVNKNSILIKGAEVDDPIELTVHVNLGQISSQCLSYSYHHSKLFIYSKEGYLKRTFLQEFPAIENDVSEELDNKISSNNFFTLDDRLFNLIVIDSRVINANLSNVNKYQDFIDLFYNITNRNFVIGEKKYLLFIIRNGNEVENMQEAASSVTHFSSFIYCNDNHKAYLLESLAGISSDMYKCVAKLCKFIEYYRSDTVNSCFRLKVISVEKPNMRLSTNRNEIFPREIILYNYEDSYRFIALYKDNSDIELNKVSVQIEEFKRLTEAKKQFKDQKLINVRVSSEIEPIDELDVETLDELKSNFKTNKYGNRDILISKSLKVAEIIETFNDSEPNQDIRPYTLIDEISNTLALQQTVSESKLLKRVKSKLPEIASDPNNILLDNKKLESLSMKISDSAILSKDIRTEVRWRQSDINKPNLGNEIYQQKAASKIYLVECRHHALRQYVIRNEIEKVDKVQCLVEPSFEMIISNLISTFNLSTSSYNRMEGSIMKILNKTPDEYFVINHNMKLFPVVREYTTCGALKDLDETFKTKYTAYHDAIAKISEIFNITIIYSIVVYCRETNLIYFEGPSKFIVCNDVLIDTLSTCMDNLDRSFSDKYEQRKYSNAVASNFKIDLKKVSNIIPTIFVPNYLYYREEKGSYTTEQLKKEKEILYFLNNKEAFDDYIKKNNITLQESAITKYRDSEILNEIYIGIFKEKMDKGVMLSPKVSKSAMHKGQISLISQFKKNFNIVSDAKRSLLIPLSNYDFNYDLKSMVSKFSQIEFIDSRTKWIKFVASEIRSFSDDHIQRFVSGRLEGKLSAFRELFKDGDYKRTVLMSSNMIKLKKDYRDLEFNKVYLKSSHDKKDKNYFEKNHKKNSLDVDIRVDNKVDLLFEHFSEETTSTFPSELTQSFFSTDIYLQEHQNSSLIEISKFESFIANSKGYDYLYKSSELMHSIMINATRKATYNEISLFNRGFSNMFIVMGEGDSNMRTTESRPMCVCFISKLKEIEIMQNSCCFLEFSYVESEVKGEFLCVTNWFRLKTSKIALYEDSYLKVMTSSYRNFIINTDSGEKEKLRNQRYFIHGLLYSLSSSSGLTCILKEFQHGSMNARSLRSPIESYIKSKLLICCKTTLEVYALHKLMQYMRDSFDGVSSLRTLDENDIEELNLLDVDEMDKSVGGFLRIKSHMTGFYYTKFEEFLADNYIAHITTRDTVEESQVLAQGMNQLIEYQKKFESNFESPSIKFSNSVDTEEFKQNINDILKEDFMFGYNEYLCRKGVRLLIKKNLSSNQKEIRNAINNAKLFSASLSSVATTKGMISDERNVTKYIEKEKVTGFDKLIPDASNVFKDKKDNRKKIGVFEFSREKAIVHILRFLNVKADETIGGAIYDLMKKERKLHIFEMHLRHQFGADREMYIQNLLTRLCNMIIENSMTTLCSYISSEFQTIPGKKKNLIMQEQNANIWKKFNEQGEQGTKKIYFLNGDATKWSLSDIIETMILCIDECRELFTDSLSEFMIAILKKEKQKVLRLTRKEQLLLWEIKQGLKPTLNPILSALNPYISDDCKEIVTNVGWFQGIYNKLSGFKHAASDELFKHIKELLIKEGYFSPFFCETLVHSDDWNVILLCELQDLNKIWCLIKYCKAIFNIKDSIRKTNMSDFVREFISDYSVNLCSEEPFIKYIVNLTFTPSMNGYESDLTEAISKITSATDRGSASIFDDFCIRLANYSVAKCYSMREGMRNDPSSVFNLPRDKIPVELGGIMYEESNALTVCGCSVNNYRLTFLEGGRDLIQNMYKVAKYITKDDENFRDDYIYTNTLLAITSSYSKAIQAIRSEFPMTEEEKLEMIGSDLELKDLSMPDNPDKRYRYMVKRLYTVSYAKAFEMSSIAKNALKIALSAGGKVISIGKERYSYKEAFIFINTLIGKIDDKEQLNLSNLREALLLRDPCKIQWMKLRNKLLYPSFVKNLASLKYVDIRKFTKSINPSNEISRIIMYEKHGLQYLIDNGFKIKSVLSIMNDIEEIKGVIGKNIIDIPELELYKSLNSMKNGKTIIRTGGRIESYKDYFLSVYKYNVVPYKYASMSSSSSTFSKISKAYLDTMPNEVSRRSVLGRVTNFIVAHIINRVFDKDLISDSIRNMRLTVSSYFNIMKSITPQELRKLFKLEDSLLVAFCADYLGTCNESVLSYFSTVSYTSTFSVSSIQGKEIEADEITRFGTLIRSRRKLSKKQRENIRTAFISRFSFYEVLIETVNDITLITIKIPFIVDNIDMAIVEYIVKLTYKKMKLYQFSESESLISYLNGLPISNEDEMREFPSYNQEHEYYNVEKRCLVTDFNSTTCINNLIIVRTSGISSTNRREDSEVMKLKDPYSDEVDKIYSKSDSLSILDSHGCNVDFVKGDQSCPARFLYDNNFISLDEDLYFKGINYAKVFLCHLSETVCSNLFVGKFQKPDNISVDQLRNLAIYLNEKLDINLLNDEKFERICILFEELLENDMKKLESKLKLKRKLAKSAKRAGDIKSKKGVSAGASSIKSHESDLEKISGFDIDDPFGLLDDFDLNLDEVENYDVLEVEVGEVFDPNIAKDLTGLTRRKLACTITTDDYSTNFFRTNVMNRFRTFNINAAEIIFMKELLEKMNFKQSYDSQNITFRMFIYLAFIDYKILKEKKARFDLKSFDKYFSTHVMMANPVYDLRLSKDLFDEGEESDIEDGSSETLDDEEYESD